MKHFISISFICFITLLLSCCTRYELEENEVVAGDGTNRLTLRISPFEKSDFDVNPSSRSIVNIDQVCSRIGFAVFDANGKKVVSLNQDSKTGSGFGTLQADLNDGDYEVVIVAHSTGGNTTISKPDSIRFTDNKLSDTFYYYEKISLKGSVDKAVTLNRCVAMFRLNLPETIPQNIKYLKFYYSGGSSALNATTGFGRINSRQTEIREVPESAYTSTDNTFEIYTIPHSFNDELKITITALAADGKSELDEKVFESVPVTQGQITSFTGAIFNTNNSPENSSPFKFTISANDNWTEHKYSF